MVMMMMMMMVVVSLSPRRSLLTRTEKANDDGISKLNENDHLCLDFKPKKRKKRGTVSVPFVEVANSIEIEAFNR